MARAVFQRGGPAFDLIDVLAGFEESGTTETSSRVVVTGTSDGRDIQIVYNGRQLTSANGRVESIAIRGSVDGQPIEPIVTFSGFSVATADIDWFVLYDPFVVTGSPENDVIGTGDFDDIFVMGAGDDVIDSLGGNDRINAGSGNDIVGAGDGDDIIEGGAGNDIIDGGNGDDVIDGGAGADTIDGGDGFDTLTYASATGGVNLLALDTNDAPMGERIERIERIVGSAFDDVLAFPALPDTFDRVELHGGGGNDLLFAGFETTFVGGGTGNDRIAVFEAGFRTYDGGAGRDSIDYRDEINAEFGYGVLVSLDGVARGGPRVSDTLIGIENAFGTTSDDVIIGSDGANSLSGFDGNDVIYGLAGDDDIAGGEGNDRIAGGRGADTLSGGAGFDVVTFNGSTDGVIVDLAANGGGSAGDALGDTYSGIEGAVGTDLADQLLGFAGINVLTGGAGNDLIHGRAGNDLLRGGDGADRIVGGSGGDRLFGGVNNDVFVMTANSGRDVIADFDDGLDRIDMRFHSGVDGFEDLLVRRFGGSAVVEHGEGNVLVVANAAGLIDAGDFVF